MGRIQPAGDFPLLALRTEGQVVRNTSLGTESGPSSQPARKQGQQLTSKETQFCVGLNEPGREP